MFPCTRILNCLSRFRQLLFYFPISRCSSGYPDFFGSCYLLRAGIRPADISDSSVVCPQPVSNIQAPRASTPFILLMKSPLSCYSVSSCTDTSIPSSSSCFGSTAFGASLIRQDASFTFGNAITSRIESCCAISITRRSRP